MASNRGAQKDVNKVFDQVKKLGKKTADEGTYEDWIDGKSHARVKWEYKGKTFSMGVSRTTSDTNASKNVKKQVEKGLKEIGFPREDTNLMRLTPMLTADEREIEEIVEKLYKLLEQLPSEWGKPFNK
jgi:hypothetical protein